MVSRALVAAHRQEFLAIRARVTAAVGAAWDQVPGLDDNALEDWLATVVPIAEATREHVTALAHGFLLAAGITPSDVAPLIRNGLPVETIYSRPFVVGRTALSNGKDFAEAMHLGGLRADSLIETDVALVNRDAMVTTDRTVTAWMRSLGANPCPLCAAAATEIYHSPDLMPMHSHCSCGIVPVTDVVAAKSLNRQRLADLKEAGGPEYWKNRGITVHDGEVVHVGSGEPLKVAIHEHGELGPVLTDASQHFTGPSDIAA
jgi:hypothetical protein